LPSVPQRSSAHGVSLPVLSIDAVLSALHFAPWMHAPSLQVNPSAQSPSDAQLLLHPVDTARSQTYGVQFCGSGIAHAPRPSHAPAFWYFLSAVHAAIPQGVVVPFL